MKHLSSFVMITFIPFSAFAADSLTEAFKQGKPTLDARYHYEFAEQEGFAKNAHASTLRTRLGYTSGDFYHFKGTIEFENITEIGDDNYNNTINGKTNRPVVGDIGGTEVNQANLEFSGIPDTIVKGGRERIILDNHRFIGDGGWRQNDQTFDAVDIMNTSIQDTKLYYAYNYHINRTLGNKSPVGDYDSNSHFINIQNTSLPIGTLTGYSYLLDLEDAPAVSSQTIGLSLEGNKKITENVALSYHAEYARQKDYADNPTRYQANYYHLAPGINLFGFTTTLGYEVLGSDKGTVGFSTPLATLHRFNGWADKFTVTPNDGLRDAYIDVSYKFGTFKDFTSVFNDITIKGQYHDFQADENNTDYGQEFGVFIQKPITPNYYIEAKYADYKADQFATDTQKIMMNMGIKY